MPPDKLKLILHIGAGKTGTTSIQEALLENREALMSKGIWYLGLMLEHAPIRRFDWQQRGSTEIFLNLPDHEKTEFVFQILRDSIPTMQAAGCKCAIWSNEWFWEHASIPVLQSVRRLQAEDVDVSVVAYVRRHDAWARSAYVQWGLKHKTYRGALQPFEEWIKPRNFAFSARLRPWSEAFADGLSVRNYDATDDVVSDFLSFAGIELPGIVHAHANEAPSDEELFLRAIFNSLSRNIQRPNVFDQTLALRTRRLDTSPSGFLEALMPPQGSLDALRNKFTSDRETVDAMLVQCGQPPLSTETLKIRPIAVDTDRIVTALTELVLEQAVRLKQLEQIVERNALSTAPALVPGSAESPKAASDRPVTVPPDTKPP